MTKSQKETILTMRRALCSYTQIAEMTGLSVGAIKSYCYRHGLNTESLKSSRGFCKNCGKPILNPSKTRPRKFCSDACKTAWWNFHRYDHKNSSSIKQFKCNVCGKEFADFSSTQRKYCSRTCYQKRGSQND
ncbi:RNA polymerase subunit sigma-70 [Ruminococcus sp.]|uniref:RNA polymerase subunit sigma-70 n=1 Tax=Ruminococcus sp. TaxID=41978 RepID=UPI0038660002